MKAALTQNNLPSGTAEPIPFRPITPRLADSGIAGKTSGISPVVVRGCVRLADFIVVTLLGALKKTGGKSGVAALCIGGGEATALALEAL